MMRTVLSSAFVFCFASSLSRLRLPGILVVVCSLLPAVSFAERIDLEIYAGTYDSVPIAVCAFPPAAGERLKKDLPWQTIADDLEFSGRFRVLRLSERDTTQLAAENIGITIEGRYELTGDTLTMECRLCDAFSQETILGKRFAGLESESRKMAHRFANIVYEFLFSERGIFESSILFIRDNGAVKTVCCMDYDGRNVRALTSASTINLFPCFADSGIFFWVSYLKGTPDLFKGSLRGAGLGEPFIVTKHTETSPSYSPVEMRLAYASSEDGNLEIYTCDIDGGDRKQLTFNRAVDTSPCWSPEGYNIAFISDRTGQPQLYVMDNEGANVRRLTFEGSYQDSPAWSPRGNLIAYTSLRNGKYDIWVITPEGKDARQVTTKAGSNEYPSWSSNGSHIVFHSILGGKSELYAIRPDGTGLKRLTDVGNARMPDWSQF